MAFQLPDLPYPYDALEPHIDAETMRIHHDLHHKAYVDNANAALEGTEYADGSVENVLTILDTLPADKQAPVRNNAGGHANHSLFWQIMGPDGGGAPGGDLAGAIDETFDGLDKLKAALNEGGRRHIRDTRRARRAVDPHPGTRRGAAQRHVSSDAVGLRRGFAREEPRARYLDALVRHTVPCPVARDIEGKHAQPVIDQLVARRERER